MYRVIVLCTVKYIFEKADIAAYVLHDGPVSLDSMGILDSYVKLIFVLV